MIVFFVSFSFLQSQSITLEIPDKICAILEIDLVSLKATGSKKWCNECNNHAHIIVTYIKENTIKKLQKLYSLPRNPTAGNKLPMLLKKKPLCTGHLLPACKMFIESPGRSIQNITKKTCSFIAVHKSNKYVTNAFFICLRFASIHLKFLLILIF